MRRGGVLGLVMVVVVLAGAPAALAAGWTAQSVPLPAGASNGQLNGVSCASSTSCSAVGEVSQVSTLAESWNGTAWSVQPTPNPSTVAQLNGVDCVSASDCTAVGYSSSSTLAEHWNGSAWTVQTTPNPAGQTSTDLNGISCGSAGSCMAVGNSQNSSGDTALAERWNGTAWTLSALATPTGATASDLEGVSCITSSSCIAVGQYTNSASSIVTLAEHWNGSSWTVMSTPNLSGWPSSSLGGVSCSSATACTAVGGGTAFQQDTPFAERWNGSVWTIETTPTVSGDQLVGLGAAACPVATSCTAVGEAIPSLGPPSGSTLAEHWNGSAWAIQSTANPEPAENALFGVSCPSAAVCFAVGFGQVSASSSSTDVPIAESYAAPPATLTFGTTAVGSLSDQFAADRKRANRYSLPTAGAVSNLQVYLQPTAVQGSEQVQGVIYADDDGAPGALVATTQAITFTSSDSAGYHRLPFSAAVDLPPGNYWLGVLTGGTSDVAGYRYSTVAGARDYNANAFSAGASNPFGAASSDSEVMSLFATYSSLGTKRFGTTTVGSSFDDFAADRKRVNRYSLATAGTVTNLVIYLDSSGTAGSQPLEGVIYGDNAGAPDQLLGTTEPFTYQSVDAAGWYDLTFKTPVTLAAGNYWLGVLSGPSSATKDVIGYRYRTVAGSRDYNANAYSAGPSNPFGPITTDGEQMSLYATYR